MTIHDRLISIIRYLTYYYCYWNEQLLLLFSSGYFLAVHFHGSMAQIFLSPGTWLPHKIHFHSTRAAWWWHVVLDILLRGLSLMLLRLVPPLPSYSEGCCQDGWLSTASSRDLSPCMIPDTRVFTNSYFITLRSSTTLLFNSLYNPGQDLGLSSSLH